MCRERHKLKADVSEIQLGSVRAEDIQNHPTSLSPPHTETTPFTATLRDQATRILTCPTVFESVKLDTPTAYTFVLRTYFQVLKRVLPD